MIVTLTVIVTKTVSFEENGIDLTIHIYKPTSRLMTRIITAVQFKNIFSIGRLSRFSFVMFPQGTCMRGFLATIGLLKLLAREEAF